jgi:thiamine phosphate synthase YjbQ (UPF0047 family)
VKKSGVKEGMVLVSAMHITASVFVNDEDPGIKQDLLEWAEKLAPFEKAFSARSRQGGGAVIK